ncbi:MAG: alpha/beta fold hydrolase [Cytophagaceae bacterium]|nr:alpha/beta fold hydrolase [Cytophagaceae bacterium]
MPIIEKSAYRAPLWMRHGHFSTLIPSSFRRVRGVEYVRERLDLPDGDFVDLDWSFSGVSGKDKTPHSPLLDTHSLTILTHGYLGNSTRPYILGAAKAFNRAGWDVLAWNMRGLSGEMNRLEKVTTHGSSDDLEAVVSHALSKGYEHVALVGFSKGGNITLKYAGEQGEALPSAIKSVVAISVPCDLMGSVEAFRGFYEWYFVRKLKAFTTLRRHLIPADVFEEIAPYQSLDEFTTRYFGPLHGYRDARDYYQRCSSLPVLDRIRVPTLILNAQNDPVLSQSCSPRDVASRSEMVFLETPRYGGHCGFYEANPDGLYWMDRRAVEFSGLKV